MAGVEELLDNDAETVILTRGMELAADLSRDSGASSGSGHPVPYGGKQRGCKDLQQACWARRICRRSIPLDLLSEPSSRSRWRVFRVRWLAWPRLSATPSMRAGTVGW